MKITREMTNELNVVLANMGCSFKFKFDDKKNPHIEIEPMNSLFIHSSIINLTDAGIEFLKDFFKQRGVDLACNNNASIFWSMDYL